MTSLLRRKRRITAAPKDRAIDAGHRVRSRTWACLWACALAVVTGSSLSDRAFADGGAAPLFLAPRPAGDISLSDSSQVEQASRQRLAERAAAVSNPNLKWKPYRPASKPETVSSESKSTTATSTALRTEQPGKRPAKRANKIAVDAETGDDQAPARRTPARASRSRFREEILQVQQREAVDPFSEPLEGPDDMPNSIPDDSTSPDPTPAPGRGQSDSGAPQPINPSDDPFNEENLPLPTPGGSDFGQSPNESPELVSCEHDKRECAAALQKLKNITIDKININIAISGQEGADFPCECELNGVFVDRNWESTLFTWKASSLCHKPLYFEEVALERYGHSLNPLIQPLFSGVHFFATIPFLPYMMGIYPPNECQYVLGYYRPGDCAPWMVPPFPFSLRGALVEAFVVTGGILIVH
jgi:hypothetical protein